MLDIITANGALYRKSACVHAAYTHTRPPTEGLVSLNSAPPIPLRTKQCLVAWNVTVRLAVMLWKEKERQVRHTHKYSTYMYRSTLVHTLHPSIDRQYISCYDGQFSQYGAYTYTYCY